MRDAQQPLFILAPVSMWQTWYFVNSDMTGGIGHHWLEAHCANDTGVASATHFSQTTTI